jgi:hypothetical protein
LTGDLRLRAPRAQRYPLAAPQDIYSQRVTHMDRPPVVKVEMFRGVMATWPELFKQAAEFSTQLGRDRLINISHSEDGEDGVVAVWYWDVAEELAG